MQLGDVLKPKVSEALNLAMDQVNHIYSLCAGAGVAVPSEILAAIYQDDDAHDTCSLTACLNPLHPGPCKGWKHSLFTTAPQAWHALEAARVEKANKTRLAKIEALKSAGKPIPKKLLTPIVAKPHPHAGKTAGIATGEAHKAGMDVSANAGVHVNEPGKMTLGQAVKTIKPSDATTEKGPKGKKPTVASKGIAAVIAQEKVTPQYKLDKAATITPEQWSGLSHDEQAIIRGELAKIQTEGFGPQQKKATELLAKLAEPKAEAAASNLPPAPHVYDPAYSNATNWAIHNATVSAAVQHQIPAWAEMTEADWKGLKAADHKKIVEAVASAWKYNPQDRHKIAAAMLNNVKPGTPEHADYAKKAANKYSPSMAKAVTLHNGGKTTSVKDLLGFELSQELSKDEFDRLTMGEKASVTKQLTKQLNAPSKTHQKLAKAKLDELTAPKAKPSAPATTADQVAAVTAISNAIPGIKAIPDAAAAKLTEAFDKLKSKGALEESVPFKTAVNKMAQAALKTAHEDKLPGLGHGDNDIHIGTINKAIADHIKEGKPGLPDVIEKIAAHHENAQPGNVKTGVENLIKNGLPPVKGPISQTPTKMTTAGKTTTLDAAYEAAKSAPGLHPPKIENEAEKVPGLAKKDLPAHVQHAIDMAIGTAPGASWSKNHLGAYQELSPDEFKALDTDVQAKILGELTKGKAKFLDPKKIKAADDLIAKFKGSDTPTVPHAPEAPKPPTPVNVDEMTPAQIKSRAEELLGPDAVKTGFKPNLTEFTANKAKGKELADLEAAQYNPATLGNPSVAAKKTVLDQAHAELLNANTTQDKFMAHIQANHLAANESGKSPVTGEPLSAHDKAVLFKHSSGMFQAVGGGAAVKSAKDKLAQAHSDFHAAAKATEEATPPPAAPLAELSDYDKKIIPDVYGQAWLKHADKTLTYGVAWGPKQYEMKNHPDYPSYSQDIKDLRDQAGKLALAYAEAHIAEMNVPIDEHGNKVMGPEYQAWSKKVAERVVESKKFDALHAQAQAKLDKIRTDVGLKKRTLPKLKSPAVAATAAESAHYKTSGIGGPNFGSPAKSKSYLVAKVGPALAVKHQTAAEKKAEKLAASSPTSLGNAAVKATPAGTPVPLSGGTGASVFDQIPDGVKKEITSNFKSMPKGKFLSDPPEDIFDNLVTLAAAHGKGLPNGLSVDQVLKSIDETHSKNLGVTNTGMLHKKITDWLETADGKAYAQAHSVADPKAVKKLTGEVELPKGVTLDPGKKVQTLAGPGKYDKSIPGDAFYPLTSSQAEKEQNEFMAAQGLKFSPQQKKSITDYTGNGHSAYEGINNYLRGKSGFDPSVKQKAVDIQSAMMPLQRHVLLKRGTGWPPDIASYSSHPEDLMGHTFEDKAFVSSTVAGSSGHFSGKPLQLTIEAPKGTPAIFVNPISHYKGTENEMLLAAGLKYKVLSVEVKNGQTFMRVRVVGLKTHEEEAKA